MKKIKYVQLEPAAALFDDDVANMTAGVFGCYWKIILYLYWNDGKMNFDLKDLAKRCNCRGNFEKIFPKIENKFQIKNNKITHKRVSRELRRVRKLLQHQRSAGLRGAKKRWQAHSKPNGKTKARESKGNVIEETEDNNIRIRRDSISPVQSLVSSNSLRREQAPPSLVTKILRFDEALRHIIRPRNQSDRTSFRNIGNWLMVKIQAGEFNEQIIPRVLEYAAEAVKGRSRNPAAVFMSILKKELGYSPS